MINEPEEIEHGEYDALVEGTDHYKIHITIKDDFITEYACTWRSHGMVIVVRSRDKNQCSELIAGNNNFRLIQYV